jgi:hypothetical protein
MSIYATVIAGGDPMPIASRARKPVVEAPSPDERMDERIRQRAYELYLQRDNSPGDELDDWLRAEAEIQREDAVDESSEESFPASDAPAR